MIEPLHLLTTFQDMPGTEGCVQSYRMNLISQEWENVIEKKKTVFFNTVRGEGKREERSVHKLRNQRTVCQPSSPSEDGLQPGPNKHRSECLRILRSCCHILGVLILWYNHIKEKRSYSLQIYVTIFTFQTVLLLRFTLQVGPNDGTGLLTVLFLMLLHLLEI